MFARESGGFGNKVTRRAREHHLTTVMAGPGTQINDPVGMSHDRLMVLHHNHGLTGVNELIEQTQEMGHVGQVQARCRLVKHEDPALVTQMHCQLQALPFATGQGVEWLPKPDVAKPDITESLQDLRCSRKSGVVG